MEPSEKKLVDLARLIQDKEGKEIDCAEFLTHVAAYLAALKERSTLTEPLRQVSQHLKVCPECREELVALIKAEGMNPETILGK